MLDKKARAFAKNPQPKPSKQFKQTSFAIADSTMNISNATSY